MQTVRRTLVKSPPELWAEVSDPAALARHLDPFGPVTITRAQPERSVAWEGEHASGEVVLEPSGWGTRVTLTADPAQPEPEPEPEPEPATAELPAVPAPRGLLARLLARLRPRGETPAPPAPGPDPAPPSPSPSPGPPAPPGPNPPQIHLDPDATASVLAGVLDDLGAAHHRPFSR